MSVARHGMSRPIRPETATLPSVIGINMLAKTDGLAPRLRGQVPLLQPLVLVCHGLKTLKPCVCACVSGIHDLATALVRGRHAS